MGISNNGILSQDTSLLKTLLFDQIRLKYGNAGSLSLFEDLEDCGLLTVDSCENPTAALRVPYQRKPHRKPHIAGLTHNPLHLTTNIQ